jgi:hypothetical protein
VAGEGRTPVAFIVTVPDISEFLMAVGGRLGVVNQLRLLATRGRYRRDAVLVIKGGASWVEVLQAREAEFRRAPSAHNTQPWVLSYGVGDICVGVDRARSLPGSDPTGRDLALGIGAFVESCLIVAADAELAVGVEVEPAGHGVPVVRLVPDAAVYPTRFTAAGRRLLRTWLALARHGLAVHPLSQLLDCPTTAARLRGLLRAEGHDGEPSPSARRASRPTADRSGASDPWSLGLWHLVRVSGSRRR